MISLWPGDTRGTTRLISSGLLSDNARAMGHVYASVKFANPRDIEEGRREKMVEERAVGDTGATFTTVPRSWAKKLALPIMGTVKARTPRGVDTPDQPC